MNPEKRETRLILIGCGVIGERRASQLPERTRIVACFDVNFSRCQLVSERLNARAIPTWPELLSFLADRSREQIDGAIIATTNDVLTPIAQACLDQGLAVLVEKPAARSIKELQLLNNPHRQVIKVGFNHRFHPAFRKLQEVLRSREDDPVLFIEGHYGNGARLGFDKEWRAQVNISGGGELLDQGVHLLDLAGVVLGEMKLKTAWIKTHFWEMPVDDNAWVVCSTSRGQTFSMHVSSTEWKNEFRFEVYTRNRRIQWHGLGRSYGPERLIVYTMPPSMGPPERQIYEFPEEDRSWLNENSNFVGAINKSCEIDGGISDAQNVLQIVDEAYRFSSRLAHEGPHPQWYGR